MKFYVVDSFTDKPFLGNPAGVILVDRFLTDAEMQSLAMEMNYSDTAFVFEKDGGYSIRWFTPRAEVNMCGHATLAAAKVLFTEKNIAEVNFTSKAGILRITDNTGMIIMEFPTAPPTEVYSHHVLKDLFPKADEFLFSPVTNYALVLLKDREEVMKFTPVDDVLLKIQGLHGLIITAPDQEYDFVSRFFDPWEGISEDPVTGSAHCVLAPYWSSRLQKSDLKGKQLSQRGGVVFCEAGNEIVVLKGNAVIVMEGMVR